MIARYHLHNESNDKTEKKKNETRRKTNENVKPCLDSFNLLYIAH